MSALIVCSVLFLSAICVEPAQIVSDQPIDRNKFLEEESRQSLGSQITLTQDEIRANGTLMHWKLKEVDESFAYPRHYQFSKHFFAYRNDVSKSEVYKIIKKMPKGAALHVHSSMMLDADSLLKMTYDDHLYACYGDNYLRFKFSKTVPSQPCQFKWNLVSKLRHASKNVTTFDLKMRKHLSMYTEDEQLWNSDIDSTWERFLEVGSTITSLIDYRPAIEKYFYESLRNFYNDNVFYVEIRSGLSWTLYELNGTKHDELYFVQLFKRITMDFIKDHPDFVGVKLIMAEFRLRNTSLGETLKHFKKLKHEMPDFIAGFDLVGQEDKGKPLMDFLPDLKKAKDEVKFYFHAGETNWFGTTSDENLIDAILLGSKRIGHAYALVKHPMILQTVKEKDIGLEVNVISNVVLSLVRDVRNHPLASYLAMGLPVVLSSDDPGAWDADPLSHDFYVAFVGVASRHADLRMLKQLALNSIKYSALNEAGKDKLMKVFNRRWEGFVKELKSLN